MRWSSSAMVANVGGEDLNKIVAQDAAKALQGRVAGVLMTQTSSQPGAEMQIRIRGQRSLNASNDPLIALHAKTAEHSESGRHQEHGHPQGCFCYGYLRFSWCQRRDHDHYRQGRYGLSRKGQLQRLRRFLQALP